MNMACETAMVICAMTFKEYVFYIQMVSRNKKKKIQTLLVKNVVFFYTGKSFF